MTDKEGRTQIYTADTSGERADVCGARLTGAARTAISELISMGLFFVNGRVPKKSDKIKAGDVIEVHFLPEKTPDLTPKNIPFDIVIDMPSYAVIDKPAGLTVHPAPGHYDDTLVNALLFAFNIDDSENGVRPGIVHRLDKDTSGLLVVAKNATARGKLSRLFGDRLIEKKYLAICKGSPKFDEKRVEAPLGRDTVNRKRMAVRASGGKEAISVFRVLERYNGAFLAEVSIYTGRTHQIRVHAAYIGHPLIGDVLYGGKGLFGFERQALHSHKIAFNDPDTGERISASSNLPQDMLKLIGVIKNR